jgi:hypothetical protein
MVNPRDGDHALGLELQIAELVEQRNRARVQGRTADAANFDAAIARLQEELGSFTALPDPPAVATE